MVINSKKNISFVILLNCVYALNGHAMEKKPFNNMEEKCCDWQPLSELVMEEPLVDKESAINNFTIKWDDLKEDQKNITLRMCTIKFRCLQTIKDMTEHFTVTNQRALKFASSKEKDTITGCLFLGDNTLKRDLNLLKKLIDNSPYKEGHVQTIYGEILKEVNNILDKFNNLQENPIKEFSIDEWYKYSEIFTSQILPKYFGDSNLSQNPFRDFMANKLWSKEDSPAAALEKLEPEKEKAIDHGTLLKACEEDFKRIREKGGWTSPYPSSIINNFDRPLLTFSLENSDDQPHIFHIMCDVGELNKEALPIPIRTSITLPPKKKAIYKHLTDQLSIFGKLSIKSIKVDDGRQEEIDLRDGGDNYLSEYNCITEFLLTKGKEKRKYGNTVSRGIDYNK